MDWAKGFEARKRIAKIAGVSTLRVNFILGVEQPSDEVPHFVEIEKPPWKTKEEIAFRMKAHGYYATAYSEEVPKYNLTYHTYDLAPELYKDA